MACISHHDGCRCRESYVELLERVAEAYAAVLPVEVTLLDRLATTDEAMYQQVMGLLVAGKALKELREHPHWQRRASKES
jgi:hypothetical protein